MLRPVFLKGHSCSPPCRDQYCNTDSVLMASIVAILGGTALDRDFFFFFYFYFTYDVKRETCAIRFTGCHDNSGSFDLKCARFRGFVGLSLSFVFGSFVVILEPFSTEGGEQGELCNYKLFENGLI